MAKTLSIEAGLQRHRETTTRPVSARELQRRFQPTPPTSLRALSIKMGPFVAERDAFHFENRFPITDEQAEAIRHRYRLVTDVIVGIGVHQVKDILSSLSVSIPVVGTFGLPAVIADAVIGEVTTQLAGSLLDGIADLIPGTFGRCGGMAFAGHDFYLLGWTVDERLGTIPPEGGVLGNYIFSRLLDSLDLNVGTFIDWFMQLHLMPIISRAANVALGAAVGSLGGPIGSAFGALLGSQVDVFYLGGPKVILDRTRGEWERIKRTLDRQAAWPIGLVYEDSTTPLSDHQVLALQYADCGDGTATLTVWDNKDANHSRELRLDFRGDELQVSGSDSRLKGIFLEEYSLRVPPDELRLS